MIKRSRIILWVTMAISGALAVLVSSHAVSLQNADPAARRQGVVLSLNGAVTPPAADYLSREISKASEAGKELVIIKVDTPGGLVTSMKSIIKSILASETPVATYVSPQGAQSASAGLYIMYAAHISAMAPATNTGAATPVTIGGSGGGESPFDEEDFPAGDPDDQTDTEGAAPDPAADETASDDETIDRIEDFVETLDENRQVSDTPPLSNDDALRRKIINDSAAYIRGLADYRGRNADWAEKAVREAVSIPATEALELGVIDLIASDLDDLLAQINGRTVRMANGSKTINTDGIVLTEIEPTRLERMLGFIADPNVAAILMSIGMLGITVELWNPGSVFPGITGATCLALGLYSAQLLPFMWLGGALMILGILGIIIEAYTPTFGLVGIIGFISFGFGLYFLFPEGFRVSNTVILATMAMLGSILALLFFALVGSRSHGPLIGEDAIRRREGVVDEWEGLEGWVFVEGERWRARSSQPLQPGDKIKVTQVDGLVLIVRKASAGGTLFSPIRQEQA